MKKIGFKSIKTRLIFWFFTIALIPLFIALVVTYTQRVNVIETRTFDKLVAIRDLKVEHLQVWFNERVSDMGVLSEVTRLSALENRIMEYNKNQNVKNSLDEIRNYLMLYVSRYAAYEEIFIINPKTGIVLVSTNKSLEGRDKFKDEYFTKPMESHKLFIKDIYYSKTLSKNTMAYSIPIFCKKHKEGHIIGILVARIDLDQSLYKMLADKVGLGKTGETFIVNNNLMALNELHWYDNAPLNLKIDDEPAVNAVQGKTGIAVSTDYRGEKILAAYTYIPETEWGFVCKQDLYELNAPIRDMVFNFQLLFTLFTFIIYLVAFFISKTISKPIIGMDIASKKIREGNFSVRNLIYSEDELGSLAKSINEMTNSIESKIVIQKGVVDISGTMIAQSFMHDFGSELLKQLMEITESNMSTFYILNELTSQFEHFTSIGANEELLKPFSSQNPEGEFGNALSKKSIYYLQDIPEDTIFKFQTTAGDMIPKEIITIPILVENRVVALISLVNIHKFTKECFDILEQSWLSINSSYSSLIANERTRIFAESLSKTNQQLESKTEELQEQSEELQQTSKELQSQTEELQEQNLELEIQRKEVEEANRLKSEFLSNMSHELRTPLNSIMALSRVLIIQAGDKLTDEENNYLEIVERNGKLLLSLINDILDLSKIEAGKMDISLSEILLDSELRLIKENLISLADEKDLSLNLNISGVIPKVETDEAKLQQVLTNIIGNALKFTEEGEININVSADSKMAYIEVEDTGIGISKDAIPFIFDEFRQVDGSSSRQYEGTGLGLAIAYKLIKALGGDIKVVSKPGSGSKFTIVLPIKWQGDGDSNESVEFEPIIQQSQKKTILVVDDNQKVVKNISDYLEKAGYNPIGTTFGSKAVELAEKYQPFAITLDVVMPDMDGWEVLQKLKSNGKTKDIPVIVVSIADDKETGFALGAVGYISKPIDGKSLISEINKLHDNAKTIMIVDDSELERKRIAEILEKEKMATILVDGGSKCLQLLKEQIPDIIVLDLIMPGMDGFQVLNRVRNTPSTKDLPVIIITAKDLTRNDKLRLRGKVSSIVAKSDVSSKKIFNEIKKILKDLEQYPDIIHEQKEKDRVNENKKPTAKNSLVDNIEITEKSLKQKRGLLNILVVEDNKDNMITITAILKNKYNIIKAHDGEDGLNKATANLPDIILLDMSLPKMDGVEIVTILKKTKETKNIPVIALTARAMKEDRDTFLVAGCDDYISKPIDSELMLKKLKEWI